MAKPNAQSAPKKGARKAPDKRDLHLALTLAARMLLKTRPNLYSEFQPVTRTGELLSEYLIEAHAFDQDKIPD